MNNRPTSSSLVAHEVALAVYLVVFAALPSVFLSITTSLLAMLRILSLEFDRPLYPTASYLVFINYLLKVAFFGLLFMGLIVAVKRIFRRSRIRWWQPVMAAVGLLLLLGFIWKPVSTATAAIICLGFCVYWSAFYFSDVLRKPAKVFIALSMVLSLFLLVAGGILAQTKLIAPALEVWHARGWSEVPIQDPDARLSRFHGNWYTKFKYSYKHGARMLQGERYGFITPIEYFTEDELLAIQDKDNLPSTCFVDPNDPDNVVLVRDPPLKVYAPGLLGAALFCLGMFVLGLGLKKFRAICRG